MPAHIVLESDDAEQHYLIESIVVRIGRGSNCDICLEHDDVPSHLLTLEYSRSEYIAHNKSDYEFNIGKNTVTPGNKLSFRNGQVLSVGNAIALRLEIDGDPAPTSSNHHFDAITLETKPDDDNDSTTGSDDEEEFDRFMKSDPTQVTKENSALDPKKLLQMAGIGLCFIGMGIMLYIKFQKSTLKPTQSAPALATLIVTAKGDWQTRIVDEVQRAEAARVRGNTREAAIRFMRIRDEAKSKSDPNDTDNGDPFAEQVKLFSLDRLSRLPDNAFDAN